MGYLINACNSYPHNKNVDDLVDVGALEDALAAVHHQLGVLAGKDDHAVTPARVAQHAAAQQHLVVVQRQLLAVHLKHTVKLVKAVVWRLAVNHTCKKDTTTLRGQAAR